MKYNVNFIIPYFGSFPNYMQLFLNSCKKNPKFHWTIITDNHLDYLYPDNVSLVYMTFDELKSKVQDKFDFKISLNRPYKLCDMKPMYGYIFEEYNKGYEFWGYCDIDIILGNLDKFISKEMYLYDKIFINGHMTIMRNTDFINRIFMKPINNINYYQIVLQSDKPYNFDEDFLDKININTIFKNENIEVYEHANIADIYTKSNLFRLVKNNKVEKSKKNFFVWNNGQLLRFVKGNTGWNTEEYMYIHLQKRKMKIENNLNLKTYKIISNKFENLETNVSDIKNQKIRWFTLNNHYLKLRINNLKVKLIGRLKK